MKKYAIITSAILILTGCAASTSIADVIPEVKVTSAKVTKVETFSTKQLVKNEKFNTRQLVKQAKLKRNTAQMKKVVKYLKTRVEKTSYVFSGSSPRGWDCSGMVRWTYERFGIELPHSANKQGHVGTRVSKPKLGDIVVFAYQGSTSFYHSAIYIGDGKIVHAHQQRKTTVIEPLSSYKRSQIRFVRLVEQQ
jgi:cell wall-associated NlpC family hydrolase